jgi:hypothetical protein
MAASILKTIDPSPFSTRTRIALPELYARFAPLDVEFIAWRVRRREVFQLGRVGRLTEVPFMRKMLPMSIE